MQALAQAKPDAILNITFGADLTQFVRAGNTAGLFERRAVASMLTGEPEYLEPLGDETPSGWIVTGYPRDTLTTKANTDFVAAYRARFNAPPMMGSVVGYAMIRAIAAGIAKSGGVDTEKMADGFKGAAFDTPFGPAQFRAIDHQATFGTFVGRTAVKNGHGEMVDWRYAGGENYLPDDATVRKLRPAAD